MRGQTVVLDLESKAVGEDVHHTKQTANSVWNCCFVLAKYLERILPQEEDLKLLRIIELGAGTGLLGICTALTVGAGSAVTITDVREAVSGIQVLKNGVVFNLEAKHRLESSQIGNISSEFDML